MEKTITQKTIAMKNISLIIIVTVFLFSSCSKNLPVVDGTAAQKMANEWWVRLYDGGTAVTDFGHIATYNTSDNNNTQIWVDDQGEIWDFKVKANADLNNLSFSASQAVSVIDNYNIKVTITDGKIIENVGKSKTGVTTDSIYMKVQFEDDPGTTYEIKGHARTRFAEDDYH
jgi:hypothetical protein